MSWQAAVAIAVTSASAHVLTVSLAVAPTASARWSSVSAGSSLATAELPTHRVRAPATANPVRICRFIKTSYERWISVHLDMDLGPLNKNARQRSVIRSDVAAVSQPDRRSVAAGHRRDEREGGLAGGEGAADPGWMRSAGVRRLQLRGSGGPRRW